jgi:hypothetical protein
VRANRKNSNQSRFVPDFRVAEMHPITPQGDDERFGAIRGLDI